MNHNDKGSTMSYAKALMAEAKDLRAKLDRDRVDADRLDAELPALGAEADTYAIARTAGEHQPSPRAAEVSARLGWIMNRLREIERDRDDGERRLRLITDRLESGPRAEQARADMRNAQARIESATRRRDANAGAVERLRTMQGDHLAQAKQHLRGRTAAILASVGIEGGGEQSEQQQIDVAVHAQTGLAIDAALREAVEKQEQFEAELLAAQEAAVVAKQALAVQQHAAREMRHAEALSQYLPVLAEFLAAHDVAHGWRPNAPDVESMVAPALADAAETFRASLNGDATAGVIAKVAKAARGLLS